MADKKIEDLAIENGVTDRGIKWVIFPATSEDDGKTMGAVFAPEGHPWRSDSEDDGTLAHELDASIGQANENNEGWFVVITLGGGNVWGDEQPDPFAVLLSGEAVVHWTTELVKEKTLKLADMLANYSVPA